MNTRLKLLNKRGLLNSLVGITKSQLVKIWTKETFPDEHPNSGYLQEWINRYERRGYFAFISHMDFYSRKMWYTLHSLWFEVNTGLDYGQLETPTPYSKLDYQLKALQREIIMLQLDDITSLKDEEVFSMFQNIIEKIKDIRKGEEVYTTTTK